MKNKTEWTIEKIQKYLDDLETNTIVLSDYYKNYNTELLFICGNCNKIFKRKLDYLLNQKYKFCKDCSIKYRGKQKRISLDTVEKKFESCNLKLLDKDYINNNSRLLCEDYLGYRGYISYNHLDRIKTSCRNGFDYFSPKHNIENLIYNINNYCNLNFIKTRAIKISENQKHHRTTILFKCECGEEFETTVNSFKSGKTKCDKCSKRKSRYEIMTELFLKENNISFTMQKRFSDCKNILPLPFDFYIESKNILIEVDGEGHYKICNFNNCSKETAERTFNLTKRNDEIKTNYCNNNNIKLIRIPYWEFENENYKNIILNNIINA